MGSRLMIFGSILRMPRSLGSSCSSTFFFSGSFSLSMPRAFSWIFFTSRCSFFTSEPSSMNLKFFLLPRSGLSCVLRLLSNQFFSPVSSPPAALLTPNIFFMRASFSRLMLTLRVLATELIQDELPSFRALTRQEARGQALRLKLRHLLLNLPLEHSCPLGFL